MPPRTSNNSSIAKRSNLLSDNVSPPGLRSFYTLFFAQMMFDPVKVGRVGVPYGSPYGTGVVRVRSGFPLVSPLLLLSDYDHIDETLAAYHTYSVLQTEMTDVYGAGAGLCVLLP